MNKLCIHHFKWLACCALLLGMSIINSNAALRGEYWLDSDPGFGNATAFTPSANTNLTIPTSTIADGWHLLGMRVKNNSNWSQTYLYMFYSDSYGLNEISAVEYFIDTDPGIGNASPAPFNPSSYTVAFTLDQLDTLPTGYHTLGLRVKRNGTWSFTYKRQFMNVNAGLKMNVEKVVAWWDNNTDNLINVPFVIENGEAIISNYIMDASALSYGAHKLHLRATADTRESHVYTYDVCKNAVPQFSFMSDYACVGDEVNILDESQDVQTESAYAWDVDGNGTTDYTDKGDILHTFTKAGTYNVTLTITTGGCESVYSKEFVVYAKSTPSVKLTRDKSASCAGDEVTFTATPTNGGDAPAYTWFRNSVEIVGESSNTLLLADLQNNDTIQVQLTTSILCPTTPTALSSKLVQKVNALPTIEFNFAESYYTDEVEFSLTGKATPTGGTFYINDVEAVVFDPKINPVGTYTVHYEVTNSNGCKSGKETTFELKERPTDPTAIGGTEESLLPHKIIREGMLFILRNGEVYNAQGARVE